MTKNQINQIIERRTWVGNIKEDRWDVCFAYFPAVCFLLAGIPILPFVKKSPELNIIYNYISVFLGFSLVFFTKYCFERDNSLSKITTNLNSDENREVLKVVFSEFNFEVNKHKYYFEAFTPMWLSTFIYFLRKNYSCKMILIPSENEIFINVKNLGGIGGRVPYSFARIYWRITVTRKIKNHVQQQ